MQTPCKQNGSAAAPMTSEPTVAAPAENIRVCFRVRPFDKRELKADEKLGWKIDTHENILTRMPETVKNMNHPPQMTFQCSTLFGQSATTEDLYARQVADIVDSSMRGVNGTIFAYGQTASGKTHTMKGRANCLGVIPLAMQQVFQHIAECEDHEFLLRVSYVEIYNERVKDLLDPLPKSDLIIHESKQKGVYVNSKEMVVSGVEEVIQLMEQGESRRHYGKTEMNDLSSRSHTILRLLIESWPTSKTAIAFASPRKTPTSKRVQPKIKASTLNFVDLAGSERLAQTQAAIGSHTQVEGSYINKSLMFLGVIISRLSEGDQMALPFRESKLTRILQPSIGGNARTSIIVTVSPSASNVEHTVSSLRFGARAITIRNHAQVNEIHADQAFLSRHHAQMESVQRQLDSLEEEERAEEHKRLTEQALQDQARIKAEYTAKLADLQRLILKSTSSTGTSGATDAAAAARRRHTFGSTPWASDSSVSSTDPDASFRAEQQLAMEASRIAQLESLLGELSAENQELLNRENRHMEEFESLAQNQEMMTAQLNLYSTGEGAASMALEELVQLEAQMAGALKHVQKQMYFAEFRAEFPVAVAPAVVPVVAAVETSIDVSNEDNPASIDPLTQKMQQQIKALQKELTESRDVTSQLEASQSRLESSLKEQQERFLQVQSDRDETLKLVDDLEQHQRDQAHQLELERALNYKYSKQLMAANVLPSMPLAAIPVRIEEAVGVPSVSIVPHVAASPTPLVDRTNQTLNVTKPTSLTAMLSIKPPAASVAKSAAPSPPTITNSLLSSIINKTRT